MLAIMLKTYLILSIAWMVCSFESCPVHTQKQFEGQRPEVCNGVFEGAHSIYTDNNRLKGYSVEDLLTIQRCGLEYSPQISMEWRITDHPDYPVPAILKHLESESDESDNFHFYLIEMLVDLTESKNHAERIKEDKAKVIEVTTKAISKMKDGDMKQSSKNKLWELKKKLSK